MPKTTNNHLIHEKSPYLLQHAHNPVNWYPWGNEAFTKAKDGDKPIFLSIGYSTCHWCHVMERESFEDEQVANLLNQSFISIKVDREERPDIDAVYMSVCQAVTGQGGWPMTIIMSPEQKPFFAATYLPKNTRYGTIGMLQLLPEIARQWKKNRSALLETGEKINSFLEDAAQHAASPGEPSKDLIDTAASQFHRNFDRKNGGFGPAPKFPTPHNLLFLLRYSKSEQDEVTMTMAEKTLEQMYRGGIFDHIGGGFSRYSTDDKWLIPHFEKMLYDNALLTLAYCEAYRLTKKELYRTVAERTLDFCLRELTHEEGGFLCGQDADSDGEEGKYYVFTPEEIETVLGKESGGLFNRWFGITSSGNFEGKSILNLLNNPDFNQPNEQIEKLCSTLYAYRLDRTKLHKDDKILTAWNGLMIGALSSASAVFHEPRYLTAAKRGQAFLADKLTDARGRLYVRWRDGDSNGEGKLDDYAFYAWALLELYTATQKANYLAEGLRIAEMMIQYFFDENNGGFYLYASDSERLISRPKEIYDGAMPSGNSVAAVVLERLFHLTGESKWQIYSEKQLKFIAGNIENYPAGYSFSLLAVMNALSTSQELICVSADSNSVESVMPFLTENSHFNTSVMFKTSDNAQMLKTIAPFTANYPIPKNGSAFYLCRGGSCSPPVFNAAQLNELLQS